MSKYWRDWSFWVVIVAGGIPVAIGYGLTATTLLFSWPYPDECLAGMGSEKVALERARYCEEWHEERGLKMR